MAWTEIARRNYAREGRRYASDGTDAEWAVVPFMPARSKVGRPRETDARSRRDEGAGFKQVATSAVKREAVAHLKARFGLSERRARRIAGADRRMVRRQARRAPDTVLRGRLRELADERRRFGCRRLFVPLRREGEPSGINPIYRLHREEGLAVRKRKARRKAVGTRAPILVEPSCPTLRDDA